MQHNNLYNVLVSRESCPKCQAMGNDSSGDNLAIYADGHAICYACRYYRDADGVSKIRASHGFSDTPIKRDLHLPADADINYPSHALNWVSKYELTKSDLMVNSVVYSDAGISFKGKPATDLLIFPCWNKDELLAYQGRWFGTNNFGTDKVPKWITRGNTDKCYHFLCNGKPDSNIRSVLIITEDIISAIKVSKLGVSSMPLWGNQFLGRIDMLLKLTRMSTTVLLWLDPNMYTKMIKESNVSRLKGLQTYSVLSTRDPKEHTLGEIDEYIKKAIQKD